MLCLAVRSPSVLYPSCTHIAYCVRYIHTHKHTSHQLLDPGGVGVSVISSCKKAIRAIYYVGKLREKTQLLATHKAARGSWSFWKDQTGYRRARHVFLRFSDSLHVSPLFLPAISDGGGELTLQLCLAAASLDDLSHDTIGDPSSSSSSSSSSVGNPERHWTRVQCSFSS